MTTSASISADAGDLPGEELGVGLGPLGDVAVELGLHPVAPLLAVLGQQDQRRGVRRLQRQHQRQQHEAAVPRVELQRLRRQQVPHDPDDDEDGLEDEEPGGAEEPGDRLAEPPEGVGVVLHADAPARRAAT